jgi:hypothetical protein
MGQFVGEGGIVDFGQAFDLLDIENRVALHLRNFALHPRRSCRHAVMLGVGDSVGIVFLFLPTTLFGKSD